MTPHPPSEANGPTVLFAGGGTGGHIFPSLAVIECLCAQPDTQTDSVRPILAVSRRPLDASIANTAGIEHTPLPAHPWRYPPWHWPAFIKGWRASTETTRALIRDRKVAAVVAMGGYVAAPIVAAASDAGVPIALVHLDAVPGKANRLMSRRADQIFSVYEGIPNTTRIGMPLRQSAIGPTDPANARRELGLDPDRPTLLVTGGSQGAQTINQMMLRWVNRLEVKKALDGWQLIHLAGPAQADPIAEAYARAAVPAKVTAFLDNIGAAWSAATVAISRAGAGSVAEAWANATPTVFLPYPHHRDRHQQRNTAELARNSACLVQEDHIDPQANAEHLTGTLLALLHHPSQRTSMANRLRATWPGNGSQSIARWVANQTP